MNFSKLGLGCVTFGREIDEPSSFAMLDGAVERGIKLLDTASAYADGASEIILGKWLKSRNPGDPDLTIATKILPPYEPARMEELVEGSLQRLAISSIDLLYLHSWDHTAESSGCLSTLDAWVRSGKVRAIGVSNFSREQLETGLVMQRAEGWEQFQVIQNNFNYAVREVDETCRDFCLSENIQVVTYSPLGAGFLTGKHKRGVEEGSRFELIPGHQDVYFHEDAWSRLERLEEVARDNGISQIHLALAWAMHQHGIDSVLIGGRTVAHLDQAIAALEWDDVRILSQLDEVQ